MIMFCPFINGMCNTNCVFARGMRIGFGVDISCLLADKLAESRSEDLKPLAEFITRELRGRY